ncbi:FHA domain-containing protein [Streptomyces sp. MBT56]|nr:FHA domain-containing protein [Streptomyces sp. MBT56]MBK3602227.1 FHA domain-containing protein [Streptomyces sp. MBT54]MBK3617643.1 FHA domain-containing protein [Streptomyces sp. MBT98]MBK6043944.1 FHA domain-containing protein [Streptomyces sp. MBT55]
MGERPATPTAPELVLETDLGSTVMSPSRDYHVGRDPGSDIVIDDDRVSWHHAILHPEDGHWTPAPEDPPGSPDSQSAPQPPAPDTGGPQEPGAGTPPPGAPAFG